MENVTQDAFEALISTFTSRGMVEITGQLAPSKLSGEGIRTFMVTPDTRGAHRS
jgi:hypothetical protein